MYEPYYHNYKYIYFSVIHLVLYIFSSFKSLFYTTSAFIREKQIEKLNKNCNFYMSNRNYEKRLLLRSQ